MLRVRKHITKQLYQIDVDKNLSRNKFTADWRVANILNKTQVEYQLCLHKLGACPEYYLIDPTEWRHYKLWFKTRKEIENAIDWFESEILMRDMIKCNKGDE